MLLAALDLPQWIRYVAALDALTRLKQAQSRPLNG